MGVFRHLWKTIGENLEMYRATPHRGRNGGKDFVVAHPSADVSAVVTGLIRGALSSRPCAYLPAYMPASIWPAIKAEMQAELATPKMGSPEDFGNFINAVIDDAPLTKSRATSTSRQMLPTPTSSQAEDATTVWGTSLSRR